MADLEFEVAKRDSKPITFTLGDDHVYSFVPPKQAVAFLPLLEANGDEMVMVRAGFDWLDSGLSEEDRDLIATRLRDPKDDLDIDTVGDLVEALTEKATGRPTG